MHDRLDPAPAWRADHGVDVASIAPFYEPRSIAVIGASRDLGRPGGRPLAALLKKGYPGAIYPVNPRYHEVAGLRCYPSVLDVPGEVDLAIVSVPAADVLGVLEECAELGVRAAIIFSAGFAEVDDEGRALQQRVTDLARERGMRIMGPNCLGLLNVTRSVMASFAFIMDLEPAQPQTLGFVTQSGALGATIFAESTAAGVGFTSFASVGNEADAEFSDFVAYLLESDETAIVGGYLEGARDGRKLRGVAERAIELGKPILIMKVGRTSAGARAASSHTGSLAGDDQVYDAFFRQTGVVRIEDLSELNAFAILHRSGRRFGRRVGILSGSGGHGVLTADRCEGLGLSVPEITGATRRRLEQHLPAFGSARNPVDLTAQSAQDRTMLTRCLAALVDDPNIDVVLTQAHFHGEGAEDMAGELVEIYASTGKPIVLLSGLRSDSELEAGCMARVRSAGIPVLRDGLQAARAVAHLAWYQEKARRAAAREPVPEPLAGPARSEAGLLLRGAGALGEHEAKRVLEHYGIPVTREALVPLADGADGAVRVARELGYPVALKVQSAQILHKTEAGGVALGLDSDAAVRLAHARILSDARRFDPKAELEGVLVQEMVEGGVEVIVGATRDPVFGPVVMFGLGGIFVEALGDVAFRVAPLRRADAEEMLEEIKGRRVLDGLRGRPPVDRDALVETLLRVSQLVTDHEDAIAELDLNPLVAFPKGVKALDALITRTR
jgi:acetyltransferase